MRQRLATLLIATISLLLLVVPTRAAVPTPADIARTVTMVFAGDPGAAGGDVNADGQASAADVSGTVLGLRSPTQPGPYTVGFRRITFTKKSATMPDQDRVLRTSIWYPGEPGTGVFDPNSGGRVNAALASGVSNLPLLMFSHGSCGFPGQSIFLTANLASYGFIVAAPPHPGNSTAEILTCSEPAAVADSFVNRPADISFVIDELLALGADPTSFFFGAIDPQRIGMSGHSYGGLTTLRVAAADTRVVAGLALAPVARSIRAEVAQIRIPMMIQVGTLDSLLGDAELAYGLLQPPRSLLEIDRMPHTPFSDFCLECGPQTITTSAAHLYILRYAVPFVLQRVAGDHQFDLFLNPAVTPPGATLQADLGTS